MAQNCCALGETGSRSNSDAAPATVGEVFMALITGQPPKGTQFLSHCAL